MAITTRNLPAALEQFIAAQVRKGVYSSRQAAIVAAVSREKRRADQRQALTEQLEAGLASESAAAFNIEDVLRRGRARRAAGTRQVRR